MNDFSVVIAYGYVSMLMLTPGDRDKAEAKPAQAKDQGAISTQCNNCNNANTTNLVDFISVKTFQNPIVNLT